MKFLLNLKRDYYSGALIVLIGLTGVAASMMHRIGTAGHMGPGFFPFATSTLLALVGLLIALTAALSHDASEGGKISAVELPDLRAAICLVGGMLAFLGLGQYFGLIPATFAIVFITALGDRKNSVAQALVLALAMSIVAAVVFAWALRLQLPMFKWGT